MKLHDNPEVAAYLAEMNARRELAAANLKPWTTRKPTGLPAFWLGARWQLTGFFHVQFYDRESITYLRRQGNQLWSGPYPAREEWMHDVPHPDPPDPAVELEALNRYAAPLTWSNVRGDIRIRWSIVRRLIHCRNAGVEIPRDHPLAEPWHASTKRLHARLRREWRQANP